MKPSIKKINLYTVVTTSKNHTPKQFIDYTLSIQDAVDIRDGYNRVHTDAAVILPFGISLIINDVISESTAKTPAIQYVVDVKPNTFLIKPYIK